MSKPKQITTQQNEYGYAPTKPMTPAYEAFKAWKPSTDLLSPALDAQYGASRRMTEDSYDSPFSGINNPVQRHAQRDQAVQRLDQDRGQSLGQGNALLQQLMQQHLGAQADYEDPRLIQTKSTNMQEEKGGLLRGILGGALSIAPAFAGIPGLSFLGKLGAGGR